MGAGAGHVVRTMRVFEPPSTRSSVDDLLHRRKDLASGRSTSPSRRRTSCRGWRWVESRRSPLALDPDQPPGCRPSVSAGVCGVPSMNGTSRRPRSRNPPGRASGTILVLTRQADPDRGWWRAHRRCRAGVPRPAYVPGRMRSVPLAAPWPETTTPSAAVLGGGRRWSVASVQRGVGLDSGQRRLRLGHAEPCLLPVDVASLAATVRLPVTARHLQVHGIPDAVTSPFDGVAKLVRACRLRRHRRTGPASPAQTAAQLALLVERDRDLGLAAHSTPPTLGGPVPRASLDLHCDSCLVCGLVTPPGSFIICTAWPPPARRAPAGTRRAKSATRRRRIASPRQSSGTAHAHDTARVPADNRSPS
jgi:hypothetical protein